MLRTQLCGNNGGMGEGGVGAKGAASKVKPSSRIIIKCADKTLPVVAVAVPFLRAPRRGGRRADSTIAAVFWLGWFSLFRCPTFSAFVGLSVRRTEESLFSTKERVETFADYFAAVRKSSDLP